MAARTFSLDGAARSGAAAAPPPPPPPCPIKLYSQFGAMARDVLYGNRAEGLFGTAGASKLSISSATSEGVVLTTTATQSGAGGLAGQLLVGATTKDGWLGDLLLTSGGVAEATFSRSFTPVIQRPRPAAERDGGVGVGGTEPLRLGTFRVGGVVPLPVLTEGALGPSKVTFDYSSSYVHVKTSTTAQRSPTTTASLVAGAGKVVFGAESVLAAGRVQRWSAAAGWHDARQHASLTLSKSGARDAPAATTLLYGYSWRPRVALAVEAALPDVAAAGAALAAPRPVASGAAAAAPSAKPPLPAAALPTVTLGATFRLPPPGVRADDATSVSGGVVKVKMSSAGTLTFLYRDALAAGPRVTLTAQVDALELAKGPRLGLALDV